MVTPRPTITIPLIDGMTLFEIGMPLEALGYAWDTAQGPLYDVTLCGDLRGVRTHTGARLTPHRPLSALPEGGTVLVPAVPPGLPVGSRLVRELRRAADRIEVDARALYVEDGGIFTSAGSAAGLDLCLHLIRRDHGQRAANAIARHLVIASHRDGDQAQYAHAEPLAEAAAWLDNLRAWLRGHLHRQLTLAELGRAVNLSPRTLARRFERDVGTTPMRWVAGERIAAARELLETTDLTVDRISSEVGYGSPVTFRTTFTHEVGISPGRYRSRFAAQFAAPPEASAVTSAVRPGRSSFR